MSWQMWVAFGIFLGFCANLALQNVGGLLGDLSLVLPFFLSFPFSLVSFSARNHRVGI